MEFSLSFFTSTGEGSRDSKYGLLLDSAMFGDRHGFTGVWTPERHFHAFGGIFPNPSLIGVLLAASTERIRIRSGSVVAPLHHPIRIAEEWSVVDNLSGGRVDVSFATGWHPDDFVLAPDAHAGRAEKTFEVIETVRALWRGEPYTGPNGAGETTSVQIHPSPVQPELPVWLTCTGGTIERFAQSGARGYNVLTALIFQPLARLAKRITEFREARKGAGLDPAAGKITLMLHAFVGESIEAVREVAREPMKRYLRSSVDLWKRDNPELSRLLERPDGLEFAFERYFRTGGLFGTVESCEERVRELADAGVDEIACLIDYGVEPGLIPRSLECLARLSERCAGVRPTV